MKSGENIQRLLQVIKAHDLEPRSRRLSRFLRLAERGLLPDAVAFAELPKVEELIKLQERAPNLLPAAPDQDELGLFDIELGELVENPGVRVGIRLGDRVRHLITSGATGSGKSTLLLRGIDGIKKLNDGSDDPILLIMCDLKGDFVGVPDLLGRDKCGHYSAHDGSFRIGLNAPGDLVPPHIWTYDVAKILGANCGLVMATSTIAAITKLGLERMNPGGLSSPGPLIWPSISLIAEVARKASGCLSEKAEYAKSLLQAFHWLTDNSGDLFNVHRGFDVVEHVIMPRRSP